MAKKNPKGNKFTIERDSKRPCFLVVEMIKTGKSHKILPDKKKIANKESCRGKKNDNE